MCLLLIEPPNLSEPQSLLAGLQQQGYFVLTASTPQSAVDQAKKLWPNLIIFNVVETDSNLLDYQRALNGTNLNIPHLVVSRDPGVQPEPAKNVTVVSLPAASPLKPSLDKALEAQKGRFLRLPGLVVDFEQRQVLHAEEMFALTPKEFKLLHLLIENSNQVLSRKTIMQHVWETDYMGDTRTLDVHVRWLREKIEDNPSRPERLITIRGVGYRFIRENRKDD